MLPTQRLQGTQGGHEGLGMFRGMTSVTMRLAQHLSACPPYIASHLFWSGGFRASRTDFDILDIGGQSVRASHQEV